MSAAKFTNAQRMAAKHPATFEAPTLAELAAIRSGDYVKVCAGDRERFWVLVTGRRGQSITGTVANELLFTDVHGLRFGLEITIKAHHVYQYAPTTQEAKS